MTFSFAQLQKDIGKVFYAYKGMDAAYVKLIREFHQTFLNPDLTQEVKAKARVLTKEKIINLKKAHFEKAKAVLDALRKEYNPKPQGPSYTTEERLLNVNLWMATMPTATIDELRELWFENKGDRDFESLLEAEIRRREEKDSNDMTIRKFRAEMKAQPHAAAFAELGKVETALRFLATMHFYPANLRSLKENELRDVDKDLAAYPVDVPGGTYRPTFDLKVKW